MPSCCSQKLFTVLSFCFLLLGSNTATADDCIDIVVSLTDVQLDGALGSGSLIQDNGGTGVEEYFGNVDGAGRSYNFCIMPDILTNFNYFVSEDDENHMDFRFAIFTTNSAYTIVSDRLASGGGFERDHQLDFFVTEKVNGCTNPTAANYEPAANVDDGNCECANNENTSEVTLTLQDEIGDGTFGRGGLFNAEYEEVFEFGEIVGSGGVVAIICATQDSNFNFFYEIGESEENIEDFRYSLTKEDDALSLISNSPLSGGGDEPWYDIYFFVGNEVNGCTNPTAANYDPAANIDNGGCTCAANTTRIDFTLTDTAGDGADGEGNLYSDENENIIAFGPVSEGGGLAGFICATGGTTYYFEYYIYEDYEDFAYSITIADPDNTTATLISDDALSDDGVSDFYEVSFSVNYSVSGCTNPTAANYEPTANIDDGGCECASDTTRVEIGLTDSSGDGIEGSGSLRLNEQTLLSFGNIVSDGGNAGFICATANTTYKFIYDIASDAYVPNFGYSITENDGNVSLFSTQPLSGGGNFFHNEVDFFVATEVNGCTNSTAANYNASANVDEGCVCADGGPPALINVIINDSFGDGHDGLAQILNEDAQVLHSTPPYGDYWCSLIREWGYTENNEGAAYWDAYCAPHLTQNSGPYALCPGTYQLSHTGSEANSLELSFSVTQGDATLLPSTEGTTVGFNNLPASFTLSSTVDCNGDVNGPAYEDNCGACDAVPENDCVQDCAGTWGGDAVEDNCGTCDNDATNDCAWSDSCFWLSGTSYNNDGIECDCGCGMDDQDCLELGDGYTLENCYNNCPEGYVLDPNDLTSCIPPLDCAGVPGGTAHYDLCGQCVGGTTGEEACGWSENCVYGGTSAYNDNSCDCGCGIDDIDCLEINPNYTIDNCWSNYCVAPDVLNSDDLAECVDPPVDCSGVVNGPAYVDNCGECDADSSNDCIQDCAGTWGGNAVQDNCGECDADSSNDCIQDCAGTWGGEAVVDCAEDCNGTAVEDCAGECNGTAEEDCAGECNGTAIEDCAGECGGAAIEDCAGECNGTAEEDCAGECNGTAEEDCTGECNGTAEEDCAGECNGNAVPDNCGECDDDSSNDCIQDCAGNWDGEAVEDNCGKCDADPSNDCIQDCAGTWGGAAVEDNCGQCDTDSTNDCSMDCAGNWDGEAVEDNCGNCDADSSNDCIQDCAGTWGGNAMQDNCGECDDDSSNDCIQDCAGTWGGEAVEDDCGTCDAIPSNDCETTDAGTTGGTDFNDIGPADTNTAIVSINGGAEETKLLFDLYGQTNLTFENGENESIIIELNNNLTAGLVSLSSEGNGINIEVYDNANNIYLGTAGDENCFAQINGPYPGPGDVLSGYTSACIMTPIDTNMSVEPITLVLSFTFEMPYFDCGNGQFVDPSDECDGNLFDCDNGADEHESCPFLCDPNNPESGMIYGDQVCDSYVDCGNGADEANCDAHDAGHDEETDAGHDEETEIDAGPSIPEFSDIGPATPNSLIISMDDGPEEVFDFHDLIIDGSISLLYKNEDEQAILIDLGPGLEPGLLHLSWPEGGIGIRFQLDSDDEDTWFGVEEGCFMQVNGSPGPGEIFSGYTSSCTFVPTNNSSLSPFNFVLSFTWAPPAFTCDSGQNIPLELQCNGNEECPDGSDEEQCEYFICNDGAHIAAWRECDEYEDCTEGEDEANCEMEDAGNDDGTTEPVDSGFGDGATEPVDSGQGDGTGEGTTEPVDSGQGDGVAEPVDSGQGDGTGDGIAEPVDSGQGDGVAEPVDSGQGDGTGDGIAEPVDSGQGDGAAEPVDSGQGDGAAEPVDSGQGDGVAEPVDSGQGDGTGDGIAEPVDSGQSDGVAEPVDSGQGDGTGDGIAEPVDSGQGDGTAEPMDSGQGDGTGDGIAEPVDSGQGDGTAEPVDSGQGDGTLTADAGDEIEIADAGEEVEIADAGEEDEVADAGEEDEVADAGEEDEVADAGMGETDLCDDIDCGEGYECIIEWAECTETDAGPVDSGFEELCIEEDVVCIAIGSDGGIEDETIDAGEDTTEPPVADAGEDTTESPLDAGTQEPPEEAADAGATNKSPDASQPPGDGCSCNSNKQNPHSRWFLMGLLLIGLRLRRRGMG